MREIKFRAWDTSIKKMWVNVQNAYDTLHHHCCEDENCNHKTDLFVDSFGGSYLLLFYHYDIIILIFCCWQYSFQLQ